MAAGVVSKVVLDARSELVYELSGVDKQLKLNLDQQAALLIAGDKLKAQRASINAAIQSLDTYGDAVKAAGVAPKSTPPLKRK